MDRRMTGSGGCYDENNTGKVCVGCGGEEHCFGLMDSGG